MHSHQSYPNITTVIHSYEYSPTLTQSSLIRGLVLLPAPAAFPAGVDPNRGSEETVRSRDQLKVQACCDQLKA